MVHGLPAIKGVNKLCDGCLIGKQRCTPFPSQTSYRTDEPLELVHGDICGPIKSTTPGGKTLFLLLVDDKRCFMWLILRQAKSEAEEAVKRIQARAEAECGKKMRVLHTDRGREFTSTSFGKYYDEFGIQRKLTVPYSLKQNGVVERQNQTIVGTVRSLLMTVGIPGRFWGEAVMTAVYLLNWSPTRSLDGKMPYETWYNKKPMVHHFRVFCCVTYIKVACLHLAKLDPRGLQVVFIGYEPGSKAYRLYDPASG